MMSSPVEQSPPRLLTPGIQEQTPAYFCRLLWHYIDALPMEGVAVSHELHFFIRQEACQPASLRPRRPALPSPLGHAII